MDPKTLLLENLPHVERIARALCRRNGFVGDEADDFRSWVNLRLVADDYAVLRKFRGDSSITTYLTVVLANLMRDFRDRKWGKWRPSAKARALGPLALQLEVLVYRDGYTHAEAIRHVRRGAGRDASETDLARLLAQIPSRAARDPLGEEHLERLDSGDGADLALRRHEQRSAMDRTRSALDDALGSLPAEERIMVRMRYLDGISVADIARHLHLPQKPLYGRIERAVSHLRDLLEEQGITGETVLADIEEGGDL